MLDESIKTNLEWTSALDIDYQPTNTRKTSIICTIGPKTNSVEMLSKLRDAGMNIVRM
ncbi:Pyruvate kinase, partial [Haplosporangium gracile]